MGAKLNKANLLPVDFTLSGFVFSTENITKFFMVICACARWEMRPAIKCVHQGFTASFLVPVVPAVDYPHSEVRLGTRTAESEVSAPAGFCSFQYVEGH